MLRMGLAQLNLLSHRIRKYHNNLLYLRTSMVVAGKCVMPLLGQIASLAWIICKQLECFPAQKHYEHRERYCPEEACTCIAPLPEGYKHSIKWPQSRDRIWYYNFPHTKLAEVKG
ncbi:hypothetical protein CICLE_v10002885mg [Citrus x clementina]|uniref:Methyltransferase n=1 Tax=Citrus clementina TaxID=85681 RepID=V4SY67_CITCL|nr:hypothetical protein CICLE_v10002885mg [Citrus x clementina]ESR45738.1 hypothetical protein CICLE_v10002885mg [Citrus x clementina]